MSSQWEADLSALLNDLISVQDELLVFLSDKRKSLGEMDLDRLDSLKATGESLAVRLQACHARRGELLSRAASESRPATSLQALAKSLPGHERAGVEMQVSQAAGRARLLQHHSFTNWLVIQRSMLHLAQLIEIIATGGRNEPTYGRAESARGGGSLVDQAA